MVIEGTEITEDPDALARAERFFKELATQSQVEPYQLVGSIGEALVLAFQDKPKESNNQLLKVVEKNPGRLLGTLPPDPEFRAMISRALQRNYDNLVYAKEGNQFPPRLNPLRILGAPPRFQPGEPRGKPGAKPG